MTDPGGGGQAAHNNGGREEDWFWREFVRRRTVNSEGDDRIELGGVGL